MVAIVVVADDNHEDGEGGGGVRAAQVLAQMKTAQVAAGMRHFELPLAVHLVPKARAFTMYNKLLTKTQTKRFLRSALGGGLTRVAMMPMSKILEAPQAVIKSWKAQKLVKEVNKRFQIQLRQL